MNNLTLIIFFLLLSLNAQSKNCNCLEIERLQAKRILCNIINNDISKALELFGNGLINKQNDFFYTKNIMLFFKESLYLDEYSDGDMSNRKIITDINVKKHLDNAYNILLDYESEDNEPNRESIFLGKERIKCLKNKIEVIREKNLITVNDINKLIIEQKEFSKENNRLANQNSSLQQRIDKITLEKELALEDKEKLEKTLNEVENGNLVPKIDSLRNISDSLSFLNKKQQEQIDMLILSIQTITESNNSKYLEASISIFFDKGKHELTTINANNLNKFTELFKDKNDYLIVIEGFTDDSGESNYNDNLSKLRAKTTKLKLVELGIDRNKINIEYFGEIGTNEHNARKVDIYLYLPIKMKL